MSALAADLTAASAKSELQVPHHSANSFQGGITSPTHPTALSHRHIWPKGPTWIGGSIGATGFRAMASVLWGGGWC